MKSREPSPQSQSRSPVPLEPEEPHSGPHTRQEGGSVLCPRLTLPHQGTQWSCLKLGARVPGPQLLSSGEPGPAECHNYTVPQHHSPLPESCQLSLETRKHWPVPTQGPTSALRELSKVRRHAWVKQGVISGVGPGQTLPGLSLFMVDMAKASAPQGSACTPDRAHCSASLCLTRYN